MRRMKLNIEISHDPAIPHLVIYPNEYLTDTYTLVFTAALFTIAPQIEVTQMSING